MLPFDGGISSGIVVVAVVVAFFIGSTRGMDFFRFRFVGVLGVGTGGGI